MACENNMIDIEISHTRYRIHEALLVHHSDYFRKERHVVIHYLEPQAFDVLVEWLYTQRIPDKNEDWIPCQTHEDSTSHNCQVDLLRLKVYVAADCLGVPQLLNTINNHIVDNHLGVSPWYQNVI